MMVLFVAVNSQESKTTLDYKFELHSNFQTDIPGSFRDYHASSVSVKVDQVLEAYAFSLCCAKFFISHKLPDLEAQQLVF